MTFVVNVDKQGVMGDLRYAMGRWTNGATDSGGNLTGTGITVAYGCSLQATGTAAEASSPVANETFPFTGNITIVTGLGVDGVFMVWGK